MISLTGNSEDLSSFSVHFGRCVGVVRDTGFFSSVSSLDSPLQVKSVGFFQMLRAIEIEFDSLGHSVPNWLLREINSGCRFSSNTCAAMKPEIKTRGENCQLSDSFRLFDQEPATICHLHQPTRGHFFQTLSHQRICTLHRVQDKLIGGTFKFIMKEQSNKIAASRP